MNLFNNTPDELYYSIASPGMGDCGSIESQGTTGLSGYDNSDRKSTRLNSSHER